MTNYVDLPFNKKLNLLRDHDFSGNWVNLEHERWCVHCGKKFNGHAVRAWKDDCGDLWLECGTTGCDGTPIDWADFPWWDDQHPETKLQRKTKRKSPRRNRKANSGDDIPF